MLTPLLEALRTIALLAALGQPAQVNQYQNGLTVILICPQSAQRQQQPDHSAYILADGRKLEIRTP